jgi:hypothetical protein
MKEAKLEVQGAIERRAKHAREHAEVADEMGDGVPAGRGARRRPKWSETEARELQDTFNRRVRERAEARYRALNPDLAAATEKKEAEVIRVAVALSALARQYWPALQSLSLGSGNPGKMWEEWYALALVTDESGNPYRNVVIADLDQVRVALEQREEAQKRPSDDVIGSPGQKQGHVRTDAMRRAARQRREAAARRDRSQLIAALMSHHRFDTDEVCFEPLSQKKLMKLYKWKQSKASRVGNRHLPGGWARYKLCCKADALEGYLRKLDDDSVAPDSPTEDGE